jgi:2-succinyl-6-hydroxy-2,4-cyclohexadiene-1-carboxylate synthase
MGGRIALYSAFSGYFRALILESASAGLADATERDQRRHSDEILAASIERNGIEAFVRHWENLPLFASQRALPADIRQELRVQRMSNTTTGLAHSLRGMGTGMQPGLHTQLPTLDLPVLLIAGELDPKFCAIAQHMGQLLPQSQVQIVANAGHAVHLEQPLTFQKLVKAFCLPMLSPYAEESWHSF